MMIELDKIPEDFYTEEWHLAILDNSLEQYLYKQISNNENEGETFQFTVASIIKNHIDVLIILNYIHCKMDVANNYFDIQSNSIKDNIGNIKIFGIYLSSVILFLANKLVIDLLSKKNEHLTNSEKILKLYKKSNLPILDNVYQTEYFRLNIKRNESFKKNPFVHLLSKFMTDRTFVDEIINTQPFLEAYDHQGESLLQQHIQNAVENNKKDDNETEIKKVRNDFL